MSAQGDDNEMRNASEECKESKPVSVNSERSSTLSVAVPPPKPLRQPTLKKGSDRPKVEIRNKELYDGRDYTDYSMVKSWPASQLIAVDSDSINAQEQQLSLPPSSLSLSAFNLSSYTSRLLPVDNKPLDTSVMSVVRQLLLQNSSLLLAQHLTLLDLHLMKVLAPSDLGLYVRSGLELITLPQGHQLRLDILERYNCTKLFVASTLLLCTKASERCKLLEQWLAIAADTYATLGNHLGFAAVMAGLSMKQIVRLHSLWANLPSSVLLKCRSQLLPLCVAMETGVDYLPVGEGVSLPYIVPLLRQLRVTDSSDITSHTMPDDAAPVVDPAELTSDLADLTLTLSQLDTARLLADQWPAYRQVACRVTEGLRADMDILDVLRTELHKRLLWGSRGAGVAAGDRYDKLDLVLTALAAKIEANS